MRENHKFFFQNTFVASFFSYKRRLEEDPEVGQMSKKFTLEKWSSRWAKSSREQMTNWYSDECLEIVCTIPTISSFLFLSSGLWTAQPSLLRCKSMWYTLPQSSFFNPCNTPACCWPLSPLKAQGGVMCSSWGPGVVRLLCVCKCTAHWSSSPRCRWETNERVLRWKSQTWMENSSKPFWKVAAQALKTTE